MRVESSDRPSARAVSQLSIQANPDLKKKKAWVWGGFTRTASRGLRRPEGVHEGEQHTSPARPARRRWQHGTGQWSDLYPRVWSETARGRLARWGAKFLTRVEDPD